MGSLDREPLQGHFVGTSLARDVLDLVAQQLDLGFEHPECIAYVVERLAALVEFVTRPRCRFHRGRKALLELHELRGDLALRPRGLVRIGAKL
jgi:hypothetical protein